MSQSYPPDHLNKEEESEDITRPTNIRICDHQSQAVLSARPTKPPETVLAETPPEPLKLELVIVKEVVEGKETPTRPPERESRKEETPPEPLKWQFVIVTLFSARAIRAPELRPRRGRRSSSMN